MGAWTEIVDYTVPSNTTSVVFNDFGTITKDDFIKVVATFINSSTSTNDIALFGNTATTNTNYHSQRLRGTTGVSAARANANVFVQVFRLGGTSPETNSDKVTGYLKLSENDRLNFFSNHFHALGNSIDERFEYGTSSGATFPSGITTLTFTGNTNGLGNGSRIQIYRLDAEKVADFVTTSNATQVDIPFPTGTFDPAINKDSEYLLVADIVANGSANDIGLTPNDLTTVGDYNLQAIIGNGSTASATRVNRPNIAFLGNTGERSLSYNHIKLSEIGAYTHQNYELRFPGTSSVRLVNHFASSTSEAITSITKLNIFSSGTNGIASGSRFILYKLK